MAIVALLRAMNMMHDWRSKSRLLALVVVTAVSAGCAGRDVRGPFRTQFVDAETGKPIEGVVFLAVWHSLVPNLVISPNERFHDAQEAVSGPDGRVDITGLTGPVFRLWLRVKFYEFARSGFLVDRIDVAPADGQQFVDPTTVLMRPAKTKDERCHWMRFVMPSPSVPNNTQKIPHYLGVVTREQGDCA